jgi:hypothetical protein
MKPWTKPVPGWKLKCESDSSEAFTRDEAYYKMYNRRFDLRSIELDNGLGDIGILIFVLAGLLELALLFRLNDLVYGSLTFLIQKVVVFSCTTVLLTRLYPVRKNFYNFKTSLTEMVSLNVECGDPYARISETFMTKTLDGIEYDLRIFFYLTWAVEISFIVELSIIILVVSCLLTRCTRPDFMVYS